MSSLGGHRRSGASGNHESGDSMGHGGFGVSVSNGGKLLPRKFLRNSTTSRGQSGGTNVKGHSGGAGSRGRSQSAKLDGSERPLRAPRTVRALEQTLQAPGTERTMLRTWGCQLLAPTPGVRPTHKQSVLAEEVHLQAWWPSWPGTQAWPT